MTLQQEWESEVYQGQFGEFTITRDDRTSVIVYRTGLVLAALSFAVGSAMVLFQGDNPTFLALLTPLYALFCLGLGVSLVAIHIYMESLHRVLQLFWGIGAIAAIAIAFSSREPLALSVYHQPTSLFGIGFTFAALTGIYFKEAFCFNRLETKFLTPLVPMLLLGHLAGILPMVGEQVLLGIWMVLFIIFAIRKVVQPIPPDIGDKSVFTYLKEKRAAHS
ncbi:MAG TPA: hypothetical protein DEG17_16910 [Cyanobacteria bacterium UBA11149]|nr:hypothetical protein [Cyanobacteria bacterium UBA11367]HBE57209.1 hypothetical protein [Cyanobacteria bacterium UBA11366]HBK66222.1 hypothetical protein [Cyanobacteria bacterium UBA11166]HBR75373.1 hypothetical protein [Cyanobacteria bacterium UBA11159]HBS72291.1 hypothetical protein [Cyanobacteria bacterium UBA11153]HBW90503.1 hypothetical protein [Cyanobacteria bacterium UBA11149]HCA93894.1 hypothetical protein [Cyanobacteria bacterium UBA9226]